jgi:hypothetical protein
MRAEPDASETPLAPLKPPPAVMLRSLLPVRVTVLLSTTFRAASKVSRFPDAKLIGLLTVMSPFCKPEFPVNTITLLFASAS